MSNMDVFDQTFEWGAEGVRRLAPRSQVVVIVDVLSFTTCVDVRSLHPFPERFPFLEAEFIPYNKYHKLLVEIKDQTVYVADIVDCR